MGVKNSLAGVTFAAGGKSQAESQNEMGKSACKPRAEREPSPHSARNESTTRKPHQ